MAFWHFEMGNGYKGWYFDFIEDWSQFFSPRNWYTFRFAFIEVEDDRCMGGLELTFILLGLGFRVRYNYAETEKVQGIQEQLKEISNELDAKIAPTKYRVGSERLYIEERGNDLWAVTDGSSVLNTDGQWEWEPSPSGRDDDFIARTRFSFSEAKRLAMEHKNDSV